MLWITATLSFDQCKMNCQSFIDCYSFVVWPCSSERWDIGWGCVLSSSIYGINFCIGIPKNHASLLLKPAHQVICFAYIFWTAKDHWIKSTLSELWAKTSCFSWGNSDIAVPQTDKRLAVLLPFTPNVKIVNKKDEEKICIWVPKINAPALLI